MYTVRIPFLVPSTTRIDEHAALTTRAQITFTLKWEGYYHVLSAVGFGSHEEANAFLGTVRSAFAWLLLQKGIVAETNLVPQQIQYNTDPIKAGINQSRSFGNADLGPVDASIDGSQAAIFETLRSVQKFTGLPLSVSTTVRSDQALSVIIDGALLPPKAKYLTLIMSLESLATATSKTPLAIELIKKWAAELEQLKNDLPPQSDDAVSLEALKRELLIRRDDSVRSQIRKLVLSTLHPDIDASDRADYAVKLYDLRSKLVHEGTVDSQKLATALTEAKALVCRTLCARFITEAQAPHHRAVS